MAAQYSLSLIHISALRDDDVEIYCIGLVGRTGLNEETLRSWASEPVDEHVTVSYTHL